MRVAIFALGLGLLVSACAAIRVDQPPSVDSETHFLRLCDRSCEDGLSCVCGVCTRECEDASDCSELAEDASCSAPRAGDKRACGHILPSAVCEAECGGDSDCATVGPAHQCDQGVCRAGPLASASCPARAAPDCDDGEHLRTETDEDGCPNPVCAADDVCTLPLQTNPTCFAEQSVYTFVAERGRCERASYGGCNATANNFATEQGCWDTCEQDNGAAACLEVWERVEPGEDTGLHINAARAVERLEGTYDADMELSPGGRVTPLVFTVSDAIAYRVRSASNPNFALNVPLPCEDSVQLEATATLETEDGSFREHWPRMRFTVTPNGSASAVIHVERPGVPSDGLEYTALRGSYVPELEPDTCDLHMTISIVLWRNNFRGDISFWVSSGACEDFEGTPGMGRDGPPGPSWLATDETNSACANSACCELISVRECSVDEQCQLIEGRLLLNEADPANLCFDTGPAGCMARDMDCDEAETQGRDETGACWLFNTACQPIGFEQDASDPTCNGNTAASVPACP